MKKVEIKLFANLSTYGKSPCIDINGFMEIQDKTTIEDIINELNIPIETVKLIFLNGRHASITMSLKDGDRLGIFPPIGGG